MGHADGSSLALRITTEVEGKSTPNMEYQTSYHNDQKALIIQSSITEEAMT